ncbi:PTS transporter subunit EIIC [Candidatus Mycoplasma pogonae]
MIKVLQGVKKQHLPNRFKAFFNRILNQLQRLGKALMFPIAVLPVAALLLRIGALISDPQANNSEGISEVQQFIGKIISTPGGIIFDNLAIVFAIGVGFGLTKDLRGEAALVSAVVWFGMTAMLKDGMLASKIYQSVLVSEDLGGKTSLLYFLKNAKVVYQLDTGVVGGIICGGLTAWIYNRYKSIELPQALSFFGGRRFIPMLGVFTILPLSLIFAIIYPWLQLGLLKMGQGLSNASGYGKGAAAAVYALFNRLLQPFGLHHILNTFMWFQLPVSGAVVSNPTGPAVEVNGDITAFNRGILGSGIFTTGFFPLFLGGLPGAALAMILTSDKDKRKQMLFFYGGTTIVAFLTGIDEPLIFAFIFISPTLYLANAFMTALIYMFVTWTGISLGIGFSAGFIDYIVSAPMSWNMANANGSVIANPLWIWLFAAIMFLLYFGVFSFVIKFKNIPIPGREKATGFATDQVVIPTFSTEPIPIGEAPIVATAAETMPKNINTPHEVMAYQIMQIIGKQNIEIVENCATRLRLIVTDNSKDKISDSEIMKTGARGIVRAGNKGYQIIIGTDVEHVADALKEIMEK